MQIKQHDMSTSLHSSHFSLVFIKCLLLFVTVYGKTGHNAACVNIEKRSINFLKMYCFNPTEGNGQVYYSGNDLSYDDKTWRAQYLDANNSVSATKKIAKGAALCLVFLQTVTFIVCMIKPSKIYMERWNKSIQIFFFNSLQQ